MPNGTSIKTYTNTEYHVSHKVAEGMPQTQIAKELNIKQPSVSAHLQKPKVKQLTEQLRQQLLKKHTTRFIARKVKEEQHANKLTDYALGITEVNPTKYQDIEHIEKYLTRQDRTGVAIANGIGILSSHTNVFAGNIQVNNNQKTTYISNQVAMKLGNDFEKQLNSFDDEVIDD